jgi:hypothetical protein
MAGFHMLMPQPWRATWRRQEAPLAHALGTYRNAVEDRAGQVEGMYLHQHNTGATGRGIIPAVIQIVVAITSTNTHNPTLGSRTTDYQHHHILSSLFPSPSPRKKVSHTK